MLYLRKEKIMFFGDVILESACLSVCLCPSTKYWKFCVRKLPYSIDAMVLKLPYSIDAMVLKLPYSIDAMVLKLPYSIDAMVL